MKKGIQQNQEIFLLLKYAIWVLYLVMNGALLQFLTEKNGGGFLTDHFPHATKAIWYFEGIYAYSPHIPGVRLPRLTHPGIIGTAPSMELLNLWNERERTLVETSLESLKLCEVVHARPLAHLPSTKGCLLGKIEEGSPEWEKIGREAARTIPGRENGGNCDIKNLSKGSKVYLAVFVEGANFSTGDMHFSQGDGEISFCGAIEMSGFLDLKYIDLFIQFFLHSKYCITF